MTFITDQSASHDPESWPTRNADHESAGRVLRHDACQRHDSDTCREPRGERPYTDAVNNGAVDDEAGNQALDEETVGTADDDELPRTPKQWGAVILSAIGAATGAVSGAVLVIGVAVLAVVTVVCVGAWVLVKTFTTVGS